VARMTRLNRILKLGDRRRKFIHRVIVNYLIKCGGAFHHGEYGVNGKYVVLMTDAEYGKYQTDKI
jgi:hypothetical protein